MIIKGKPEQGLQKHQQDAYNSIIKSYETTNKASVIMPTGCGKSFVSLQLMEDNRDKRILFLAPTKAIKNQMYNYIAKYIVGEKTTEGVTAKMIAEEHFPNLKIMLYPSLLRISDKLMDKLNPDIIIMDELHRTLADKWGERINTLLEKNPDSKILGLTATPDRMDDKNVVDELFEGTIDYELTLVDAIRYGIVKAPTYIKCDYALGEYLDGIRAVISNCNDEQKKKQLQNKYNKMRKIVEQADGIPELFEKNIKNKNGKYIIFCRDKQNMDELIEKSKEWFKGIDDNPEIYSVFSGKGYTEKDNRKSIEKFESSKSEHIKLLFSIEMLNEGLHLEDISGVIMSRTTDSRIIYLQQLGRAMFSDPSKEKTIVFDLVNNYIKNNLDVEVNSRTNPNRNIDKNNTNIYDYNRDYKYQDIDTFRIQGETKEFLELLKEVKGIIDSSNYLNSIRNVKIWMEERKTTKPPSSSSKDKEERQLGNLLKRTRHKLIKPYLQLKTEEEKQEYRTKHPEIEEILEIIQWIDENNVSAYLTNARQIKNWMEERKTTKPPTRTAKDKEEKKLGNALSTIRKELIKPYLQLETEEEKIKYKIKHPELKETLEIINWIDENNISTYLKGARQIKIWMEEKKTTKPPSSNSTDKEEKRLGIALRNMKNHLIKPYLQLETEEEKIEYKNKHSETEEVLEIINWINENNISPYLTNARQIKTWMEERKTTKPPSMTSKDKEEKRLATALGSIKERIIKPYLQLETKEEKAEYEMEHPEVYEIMNIINQLNMKNRTEKQKQLALLIKEDLKKRNKLQEAKELEQNYQKQLSMKIEEKHENTHEEEVYFNE